MKPIPIAAYRFEGGNIGSFMFVIFKDTPHNCAKTSRVIFGNPKFREKAQFKRIVCTRNKPRYATFIRLRARYKFASANSVQQC